MDNTISSEVSAKIGSVRSELKRIGAHALSLMTSSDGRERPAIPIYVSGGIIPWLFVYHDQPYGKIMNYEGDLDLYITWNDLFLAFGITSATVKSSNDFNIGSITFRAYNPDSFNGITSVKSTVGIDLLGSTTPPQSATGSRPSAAGSRPQWGYIITPPQSAAPQPQKIESSHFINFLIMDNNVTIFNAMKQYDMQHLTSFYDIDIDTFISTPKTLECLQRRLIMPNVGREDVSLRASRVKKYMDRGFKIHDLIKVEEFGDELIKQDNFNKFYAKNKNKITSRRS